MEDRAVVMMEREIDMVHRTTESASAPIGHPAPEDASLPYLYRWDCQGRKGQSCRVLARGKMNSCLLEFADGYQMVTSRNAIKRNKAAQLSPDFSATEAPAVSR
jgi:hypothetical protein